MIDQILFSNKATKSLKKILDLCAFDQKILASNIANCETPGYKAKNLKFDEILKDIRSDKKIATFDLTKTDVQHISLNHNKNSLILKIENDKTSYTIDENSVNLDKEMARLAENQLIYNSSLVFLRKKGQILITAITEGRR